MEHACPKTSLKKRKRKPSLVVHICSAGIWEAEMWGTWVQSHRELLSEAMSQNKKSKRINEGSEADSLLNESHGWVYVMGIILGVVPWFWICLANGTSSRASEELIYLLLDISPVPLDHTTSFLSPKPACVRCDMTGLGALHGKVDYGALTVTAVCNLGLGIWANQIR